MAQGGVHRTQGPLCSRSQPDPQVSTVTAGVPEPLPLGNQPILTGLPDRAAVGRTDLRRRVRPRQRAATARQLLEQRLAARFLAVSRSHVCSLPRDGLFVSTGWRQRPV